MKMAKKKASELAAGILSKAMTASLSRYVPWEQKLESEAYECLRELALEASVKGVSWRSLHGPFLDQFPMTNPPKQNAWLDARRRIMEASSAKKV
jgi:hypothetical protein